MGKALGLLDTSSTSDPRFGSGSLWSCDFLPGLANRAFSLLPKWSFYILCHYSMAGPIGRGGPRISEHWEREDGRQEGPEAPSASPSPACIVKGSLPRQPATWADPGKLHSVHCSCEPGCKLHSHFPSQRSQSHCVLSSVTCDIRKQDKNQSELQSVPCQG